ncbi:MAG: dTDP-4-dehydrorhamnose 3,5-epimerase [Pseudonocardiales bacterium]|nr:MAG: dTDP-4-dehydrorhamnose 3,5-epimerase [Pseudonocardiales bacterium]
MTLKFRETPLAGSFVVAPTNLDDERGSFGRLFDEALFREQGLSPPIAQTSFSYNIAPRTLRGMHYQRGSWAETKLVRCTRGRVFDVIVDLRPGSPTRLGWFGLELDEQVRNAIYVPVGFAHGFVTLTPNAELHYQITPPHHPDSSAGLRWDDPSVAIDWPVRPSVISERDATYPLL